MKIQHVFFDLDHTLWDFETNSANAFRFILNENNIDVKVDEFLCHYKPINHAYWKLFREERISKPDLRYGRLKDTFDKLKYTISDDLINHLAIVYIDELPNYNQLFEGAIQILNYLKAKYNLHIITNGFDEVQRLKLKRSGIDTYFQQIITSESVGVKKPNPKIFEFALEIAKAKAKNSVMIGDNLEADIQGAMNINMGAIFCNFENEPTKNGLKTVDHLMELKQYL